MSFETRILIVVGLLIIIATACNRLGPPVTVATPELSPTSPGCTEGPSGLELWVDSLGNRRVRVRGEGFLPGEQLVLVFSAQADTPTGHREVRQEVRPIQPVGEDGTLTWDETMQPLDGDTTWDLAVVHAQGVACVTFVTP
jgi:hypothetical protein